MNSQVEVTSIRIKVKSCIKNITNKNVEKVSTNGIKNKNRITYKHDDTIIKIEIKDKRVKVIRENDQIIHTFNFELNKETKSEYYIKEYQSELDIAILTTKLDISEERIEICYIVKDSQEEYNYILEME